MALVPLLALAAVVVLVLVVFGGGYGYHRDELYFLAAGRHLAWAYPDQGPLTPLLAHVMNSTAPGSLTVLRVPSALMAGATSLLMGAIYFELGGTRRAQLIVGPRELLRSRLLWLGLLIALALWSPWLARDRSSAHPASAKRRTSRASPSTASSAGAAGRSASNRRLTSIT